MRTNPPIMTRMLCLRTCKVVHSVRQLPQYERALDYWYMRARIKAFSEMPGTRRYCVHRLRQENGLAPTPEVN